MQTSLLFFIFLTFFYTYSQSILIRDLTNTFSGWTQTSDSSSVDQNFECSSQRMLYIQTSEVEKTYSVPYTPSSNYLKVSLNLYIIDLANLGNDMIQIFANGVLAQSLSYAKLIDVYLTKDCSRNDMNDYLSFVSFFLDTSFVYPELKIRITPKNNLGQTRFGISNLTISAVDQSGLPGPSFLDYDGSYTNWQMSNGYKVTLSNRCEKNYMLISSVYDAMRNYIFQTPGNYKGVYLSFSLILESRRSGESWLVVYSNGQQANSISTSSLKAEDVHSCFTQVYSANVSFFISTTQGLDNLTLLFQAADTLYASSFIISDIRLAGATESPRTYNLLPLNDVFSSMDAGYRINATSSDLGPTTVNDKIWIAGGINSYITKTFYFKNTRGAVIMRFEVLITTSSRYSNPGNERISFYIDENFQIEISTTNFLANSSNLISGNVALVFPVPIGRTGFTAKFKFFGVDAENFFIRAMNLTDISPDFQPSPNEGVVYAISNLPIPLIKNLGVSSGSQMDSETIQAIIAATIGAGFLFCVIGSIYIKLRAVRKAKSMQPVIRVESVQTLSNENKNTEIIATEGTRMTFTPRRIIVNHPEPENRPSPPFQQVICLKIDTASINRKLDSNRHLLESGPSESSTRRLNIENLETQTNRFFEYHPNSHCLMISEPSTRKAGEVEEISDFTTKIANDTHRVEEEKAGKLKVLHEEVVRVEDRGDEEEDV